MAQFKVAYNPTTKVANVLAVGAATPGGSVDAGNIPHDPSHVTDREDPLQHVLYQTVQNAVLLTGETDFNGFSIKMGL